MKTRIQKHTVHLMVILKSNKEELHSIFLLLANTKSQATSFAASYNWTTRLSKISPVQRVEPAYLLEYTMAVSHGLFEEDGAF